MPLELHWMHMKLILCHFGAESLQFSLTPAEAAETGL